MEEQGAQQFDDKESLTFLAQEISSLSINERDPVLHDIHGWADLAEEDPELVTEALAKLDVVLERKLKEWEAVEIDPQHIEELRLVFLRRYKFEAEASASCMIRHF